MAPLLLKSSEAARLCGVSLRLWQTWNAIGKNPAPVKIGRTLFWKQEELVRWVDAGCPTRLKWNSLSLKKADPTDSKSRKKE